MSLSFDGACWASDDKIIRLDKTNDVLYRVICFSGDQIVLFLAPIQREKGPFTIDLECSKAMRAAPLRVRVITYCRS